MKRLLKIVGLLLFGLVVGLGGLEAAFRLAGVGGPPALDATYDRSALRFAPDGSRRNPWARNEEDVFRVAVIGDSFTNNFSNQWYDGYGQRLEHLLNLNEAARPVDLRVFAKNGTSTWQQRAFLDRALDWGAELVILGVFLNDAKPPGDQDIASRITLKPPPWQLALLRRSRALAWIYLRYENALNNWALQDQLDLLYSDENPGFKMYKKAVRYFARTTRKHDVGLVAAIWPNMFALGPHYPLELAHERLGQVLSDAGVPYIDLLEDFRMTSPVRMATVPGVDSHPSEIAHRVAATAIFHYLLEEGHVDGSFRPRPEKHQMGEGYWLGRLRQRHRRFAPPQGD